MDTILASFTAAQLTVIVVSALVTGFSKTGIIGLGVVVTPFMASVFPTGASLGFMLPLHLLGDLTAIALFNRKVAWRPLRQALPWGLAGCVVGWLAARGIGAVWPDGSERLLRVTVGVVMASVVALSSRMARRAGAATAGTTPAASGGGTVLEAKGWYAALLGSFAGLAGMLTNSGGPIWGLFFSSLGLEVREVVSATVWCFFAVNIMKLPLSANLGFMDWNSLRASLVLAPATLLGVFLGMPVSGKYSKKTFGRIIRTLTVWGAAYMIFF